MRVRGNTLTYISQEHNDFYRLIDGVMGKAKITCYFNDDGKITGTLYERLSSKKPLPPNRRYEFERWAAEHYPGLRESDDMKIPKNPQRWRGLLVEWRNGVGLPPLD